MSKNRLIERLVATKAIDVQDVIIHNYKKMNLVETEAMLLIHLYHMKEQGNDFLSINYLTDRMSLTFVECSDLVLNLVQRGFIAFDIDYDDKGIAKETYTLDPLYDKINQLLFNESETLKEQDAQNEVAELIHTIESEFGRTCSSFEIQLIASWVHEYQFSIELIKAAIKEAILANAYNLKYVDRILLNWKSKNIRTAQDAAEYTNTYKKFEVRRNRNPRIEEEEYVSWMKS